MSEKREKQAATLYEDRGEFLSLVATEPRKRFHNIVNIGEASREFWGFAASKHQFDLAVAELMGSSTVKLSNADIQRMMADEFKALRAAKESA